MSAVLLKMKTGARNILEQTNCEGFFSYLTFIIIRSAMFTYRL